MKKEIKTQSHYSAVTCLSPMAENGEEKNQDRARWYEPDQIACVCDGVSSSPYSDISAQILTDFAPAIFSDKEIERMHFICDLLMKLRKEALDRYTSSCENNDTLQSFLQDIARSKCSTSFQSTLMAVKLTKINKETIADIIKCGDSAMFVFNNKGVLLNTTLKDAAVSSVSNDEIIFGPGDELIVKVIGKLSEDTELSQKTNLSEEFAKNWSICKPVDGPCIEKCKDSFSSLQPCLKLNKIEKVIVPDFLLNDSSVIKGSKYCAIEFSSLIRAVSDTFQINFDIVKETSETCVLPDHFYCGHCQFTQDRFPLDSHFVLGSDGFYSAFSNSQEMWNWLQENSDILKHNTETEKPLDQLHEKLQHQSGDDDISFIWAYPVKETGGN